LSWANPIFTLQNYLRVSLQQWPFAVLRFPIAVLLGRIHHRAVLVALIQGVVRAFHENFGPLDQGSGEKSGESTDQDFLKEGGVHPIFNSNESAS
jgi:hypothetical protein